MSVQIEVEHDGDLWIARIIHDDEGFGVSPDSGAGTSIEEAIDDLLQNNVPLRRNPLA